MRIFERVQNFFKCFFKKKVFDEQIEYVERFYNNPIIKPIESNVWESYQTFNPGAALCGDKIILVYRALGLDGMSRMGFAASKDGLHIDERLSKPIYEHQMKDKNFVSSGASGGGWCGGGEDPRVTYIEEDDKYYIAYTACQSPLRVAYVSFSGESIRNRTFKVADVGFLAPPVSPPPLYDSKNWMIFPEKKDGKYIVLHTIVPKPEVFYLDRLNYEEGDKRESNRPFPVKDRATGGDVWDQVWRSAAAPPLKTKDGWLLFYHAHGPKNWGHFQVGAMMLDINDPTKILYRSQYAVMYPEKEYELHGYKGGVIYVSGTVIRDGMLYIYYGSADDKCCVAYTKIDEFLVKLKSKKKTRFIFSLFGNKK